MLNTFNITDFGAKCDGKTDCTKAIQTALDEAGKVKGKVIIPPGEFLCGYVRVPRNVMIEGAYAWEFAHFGGSILKLNDENAPCLLDFTAGFGCCIDGLSIDGNNLGDGIHGVMIKWEDRVESRKAYNGKEDTPTIANCRIGNFSGDAVHYEKVWCFTIRNSMLCFSENGLFVHGCDAFITDNWFSCNRCDGVRAQALMAGTFTGNRIECNCGNGVYMYDCGVIQFANNYFDANGRNGFYAADEGEDYRGNLNFSGNIFFRSGFPTYKADPNEEISHLCVAHATNVVINGNTFTASDGGKICPEYALCIKQLRCSVVKNNTFMYGSGKQNILNLGGHKEDVIIDDNVGVDALSTDEKHWPRFDD